MENSVQETQFKLESLNECTIVINGKEINVCIGDMVKDTFDKIYEVSEINKVYDVFTFEPVYLFQVNNGTGVISQKYVIDVIKKNE